MRDYQSEMSEREMKDWTLNPCTQEFLKILLWEKEGLSHQVLFKSDDNEVNALLVGKGKVQGVDRVIDVINNIATYEENPEEEEEENA